MTVPDTLKPLPAPKRIGDFSAIFGYIVLCAPNRFPENGLCNNDQSLLLEANFKRLLSGLPLAKSRLKGKDQMALVEELIRKSLEAYRANDRLRGAKLLQNAGHIIWPSRFGHDASVA